MSSSFNCLEIIKVLNIRKREKEGQRFGAFSENIYIHIYCRFWTKEKQVFETFFEKFFLYFEINERREKLSFLGRISSFLELKEEGDCVFCEDFITPLERDLRSSGYFCVC